MQTYRIRAIPRACKPLTTITAPQSARAMGTFFPHFPSQTFAPFFREFDSLFPSEHFMIRPQQQLRPFTPKFDIEEVGDSFSLRGELPGINQEDINIEFVDGNTLLIQGKTATQTNITDVKGKAIEGSSSSSPNTITADNASETSANSHKATVEDEYVDAGAEKEGASTSTQGAPTPATTNATELTTAPEQPRSKFWVSERSVGEFQRTFSFPGKVNQEAVKASLKNGILSIVVPKAAKQERKIAIE
ncbi:MAG: hypothetical protein Q9209_001819 [Squamulea sp. 1 TL-2023]